MKSAWNFKLETEFKNNEPLRLVILWCNRLLVLAFLANLFNLESVELDWRFATKHGDHDFKLAFSGIDFSDRTFKALERTVSDGDNFIECIVDGVFWIFDTHTLLDFGDFFFGNWGWLSACANKAGDAWSVSNDVPSFIGETHLNKDVTLEDFAVNNFTLAVLDLDLLFLWYDGIKNFILELRTIKTLFD